MIANDFRQWIIGVTQLTKRQKLRFLEELEQDSEPIIRMPGVIKNAHCERCPHCNHERLHKDGHASGLQRWRCTKCGKSFNALTNTPLARLRHREKWAKNAEAMSAGLPVRKTAKICDVHPNTSFRWRHRFLDYHRSAQYANLTGIAECDTTYFRHSEKGSKTLKREPRKRGKSLAKSGRNRQLVAILTLRSRAGKGADRLAIGKQRSAAEDLFKLHLRADTLLITDGDHELCNAAKARNIVTHLALPGSESRGVKGSPFHLQVSNAFHSSLKTWMARFNGVATKYLENYVGWHRHLSEGSYIDEESFIRLSFSPLDTNPELMMT